MLVCFECLDFAESWAIAGNEILGHLCFCLPIIHIQIKQLCFSEFGKLGHTEQSKQQNSFCSLGGAFQLKPLTLQ